MAWNSAAELGRLDGAQNERSVGSAEAEGVAQARADAQRPGFVGHVVQIAAIAGIAQIDGWRADLIADGQNGKIASTAPAAPSRCPVMDLVELTATRVSAPNTCLIARVSARSPKGVEVPWAFT